MSGKVVLPTGTTVSLGSLKAVTGLGSFAVAADGTFTAQVIGDAPTEIDVLDGAGALVLSAVASGAAATTLEVSSRSSAAVLLYYTLGGFVLPTDAQAKLWDLVQSDEAIGDIEATLSVAFAAGGLPLTDDDATVAEALDLAWQSVMGPRPMALSPTICRTWRTPPPSRPRPCSRPRRQGEQHRDRTRRRNGPVRRLRHPQPLGHRGGRAEQLPPTRGAAGLPGRLPRRRRQRPGPVSPVLTASIDVPSTGSLGVFQALTDIVKGESPWSPVVSDGPQLTLHDGLRTYYELVLLGPSLDAVTRPPLYDDPRFASERGKWNEMIGDKALELFMYDIALPVMENFAFGGVGHIDASKLGKLRQRFKAINDTHLAGLGVFLGAGGGYAEAVKIVLTELATNNRYRLDFFETMVEAMIESEKNKASFEAMEARMKSRASASGIAAAVQLALSAGDVGAIIKDLNDALPAVSWTATASPTLFALNPELAYFTKAHPQVELSVSTRGPVTGNFMYRWSTSGAYGELTDGPKKGTTIDTSYSSVWYTVRAPHTITDDQKDGVSVAVYAVEPGTTTIPADQPPIARLAAELKGFDREIDARLEVRYGSTPAGEFKDGMSASCATMFLHIPKETGAKKYSVNFAGFGGVGHPDNPNAYLYANTSYTWEIDLTDPNARIWSYKGVCDWRHDDDPTFYAVAGFATREAGNEYLVAVYTSMAFLDGPPPGARDLPEKVMLWYDWASQGTVTVTYSK